jgi:hypothetical protein
MMEKLVEWLAGETEVLGENLPQCRFVHHNPHIPARTRTRATAVGSQRLTAWATGRPYETHKYSLEQNTEFVSTEANGIQHHVLLAHLRHHFMM